MNFRPGLSQAVTQVGAEKSGPPSHQYSLPAPEIEVCTPTGFIIMIMGHHNTLGE
jgi:hypothetical protein